MSETIVEKEEYQDQEVPQVVQKLWKGVWKLKTVSKIRHFVWKALKGALAVKERLQSRGMYSDMSCPSCSLGPESICHVLFTCPAAIQVWNEALSLEVVSHSHRTLLNIHHVMACIDKVSVE